MNSLAITETDRAARQELRRYKAIAAGLLVAMAALLGGSYALPQTYWTGLLQACAKAGVVGGIADWFAVTALFRHPLGLPIPHTAIIPRQKARLGQSLGRFVAGHVFTPAEVARLLARVDVPGIVARVLKDPAVATPAARALTDLMPRILATVEDGRARRMLARIVPRMVGGAASGRIVGRALRTLVEGGRHQEALGFLLGELRVLLDSKHDTLHSFIQDKVRASGGRVVGWVLGAQVAERVLGVMREELDRVGPDGGRIRIAFDEWVRSEIDRIETDPARAAEIGAAVRRVVAHDTVQVWLWDVWSRLRLAIEADATRPDGRAQAMMAGALANLGAVLTTDENVRQRLQRAAEGVVAGLLPNAQTQLAGFIGDVVARWDADTITDKLELRVGKDLQWVRFNGTLVGAAVGGVLYVLLTALFGHAAG